jgi:hypothetical protein
MASDTATPSIFPLLPVPAPPAHPGTRATPGTDVEQAMRALALAVESASGEVRRLLDRPRPRRRPGPAVRLIGGEAA